MKGQRTRGKFGVVTNKSLKQLCNDSLRYTQFEAVPSVDNSIYIKKIKQYICPTCGQRKIE